MIPSYQSVVSREDSSSRSAAHAMYSWDGRGAGSYVEGAMGGWEFAPRKLIESMPIKSIMVKELVDATGYLVDVIVGQLQGLEGTQTFSKIGTWHT